RRRTFRVLFKHLNGQQGQEYAPMDEHSKPQAGGAGVVMDVAGSIGGSGPRDVLTEIIRKGAADLLGAAVQAEVAAWIDAHAKVVDENGRRQVVRNGSMP